jgi:replicative DNA helicase
MSDLRESGSIEQDADIVALLYRDDYYQTPKDQGEAPDPSLSELIIGKHRNGPTGIINLLFKKSTSTFLNFMKENKGESNG